MLNIDKSEYNEIILYLNEDVSIKDPYFIFKFKDIYNRPTIVTLTDRSTADSYNKFSWTDSSDFSLYSSGHYYVYESAIDTSILTNLTELENAPYNLIIDGPGTYTFDPCINYTEFVFDPCSNCIQDEDILFDPRWVSGELPVLGIPAYEILQDTNHVFITNASLNELQAGYLGYDILDGGPTWDHIAVRAVDGGLW